MLGLRNRVGNAVRIQHCVYHLCEGIMGQGERGGEIGLILGLPSARGNTNGHKLLPGMATHLSVKGLHNCCKILIVKKYTIVELINT